MKTRSQTVKPTYEFIFDFDEASKEWKANKKSIGNSCYKYICLQKTKQGKLCKREACSASDYCIIHKKF